MLTLLPADRREVAKRRRALDLAACVAGFALVSKSLQPMAQISTPAYELLRGIAQELHRLTGKMHDTVAHSIRVALICRHILSQLVENRDLKSDPTRELKMWAACLCHDIGKEVSVPDKDGLDDTGERMFSIAKTIAKAFSNNLDYQERLVELADVYGKRAIAQEMCDKHAVLSTRLAHDKYSRFTNQMSGWRRWLLPVLCHHHAEAEHAEIEVDRAMEYLGSIPTPRVEKVEDVVNDLKGEDRLLTDVLVVADKIEDLVGFMVQRQARVQPDVAVLRATEVLLQQDKLSAEVAKAVDDCRHAIESVYMRELARGIWF